MAVQMGRESVASTLYKANVYFYETFARAMPNVRIYG
jgi:hypothetical protein